MLLRRHKQEALKDLTPEPIEENEPEKPQKKKPSPKKKADDQNE